MIFKESRDVKISIASVSLRKSEKSLTYIILHGLGTHSEMFGDLRICLILITAHAECGLLCFRHIGNHQIYHFKKIGCSHNFLSVAETAVPSFT